ncbi:hypothetical protein MPL1032_20197 [Mesorhizobium plurifarium]|uniref:Uncharacterized protein n=1 Tax=Mesorhizobium plurifarium TaxID=69974 RepID=A0A0K2VW62_MESPL|nr:hypothetical protein MPL1032_20197 [Mesorhizobium plurifarium]
MDGSSRYRRGKPPQAHKDPARHRPLSAAADQGPILACLHHAYPPRRREGATALRVLPQRTPANDARSFRKSAVGNLVFLHAFASYFHFIFKCFWVALKPTKSKLTCVLGSNKRIPGANI